MDIDRFFLSTVGKFAYDVNMVVSEAVSKTKKNDIGSFLYHLDISDLGDVVMYYKMLNVKNPENLIEPSIPLLSYYSRLSRNQLKPVVRLLHDMFQTCEYIYNPCFGYYENFVYTTKYEIKGNNFVAKVSHDAWLHYHFTNYIYDNNIVPPIKDVPF